MATAVLFIYQNFSKEKETGSIDDSHGQATAHFLSEHGFIAL